MKKLLIAFAVIAFANNINAQEQKPNPLSFSGYLDTYYTYDFNNPENNTRPVFVYAYNRTNEVNINLAFLRGTYQTENIKGVLAMAAGTYMNANYAAESGVLKNIYEAYTGVKISKTKNLWVEAGVMPSHIGFESAHAPSCMTLTRSIMADNSPYFETGARINYTTDSGKWYLSGLVLNGWQRIQRPDGNHTPAFGTQVTYNPTSKVTLNSSTFIGNDKPDTAKQMRYFHNLYGAFHLNPKWEMIAGFDIGAEQKAKGSEQYNCWYTPVIIAQYKPTDKVHVAARGEYYSDKNGVIISTGTPNGFQTFGYSANFDYVINSNALFRIEARSMNSKDNIFTNSSDNPTNNNVYVTTALQITF